MKRIAVLITCFNRKNKTLSCLNTLFSQNNIDQAFSISVYLVDDKSTDGTAEAVYERFPSVHIIKGTGSLYWNRGMHVAWEAASSGDYDYYLWINDDTDLMLDAIDELLECETTTVGPALVCGAIRSRDTSKFTYGGADKNGIPVEPNGEVRHCYIINGNCVLVNASAFNLVGNIDPVFPHAIGDHDYGLRLLKAGGTIVTTKKFIGYCERNVRLPKWCYKETPFKERLKALYSPLGNSHPWYYFIYENRHFGFILASKHFLSIHLRVLIPSLWK